MHGLLKTLRVDFLPAFFVALLYFLLAWLGFEFANAAGTITVIWPASGVAFVALVLYGKYTWLGVLIGSFASGFLDRDSTLLSFIIACGNTLEPVVSVWLLKQTRFNPSLNKLSDYLSLLFIAAIIGPTFSAGFGVGGLYAYDLISLSDFFYTWLRWWMADCIGVVMVAPTLLVWIYSDRMSETPASRKVEGAAVVAFSFLAGQIIFLEWFHEFLDQYAYAFWVLPGIAWAGLRFGRVFTSLILLLMSIQSLWGSFSGIGYFSNDIARTGLINLWLFNAILYFTGMTIALTFYERKQFEDTLEKAKSDAERANKVKSEFIATMSHELRTPMNGVLGIAQILERSGLNKMQKDYVDMILRTGNALSSIINDVLDLSKLEAQQLKLEARTFNLEQLCRNVLDMFISESESKKLEIKLNYQPEIPHFFIGDPLRIQQVLINLVGNAVKFTPRGSVDLTVASRPLSFRHTELNLSVKDTGIGIAAKKIDHLFEPFIQADQTTTRKFGGTGLGLAVSKKLIHLMNGSIHVESQEGNGSHFWVALTLPVADAEDMPPDRHLISPVEIWSNAKVLLVEDDKVSQVVALNLLRQIGLNVDLAENGRQALNAWHRDQYDLIFMDCRMPEMNGYDAAQSIRELEVEASIPIIALTANSSPEDIQRCLDSGMNDVLTKPFKKERLLDILTRWLNVGSQNKSAADQSIAVNPANSVEVAGTEISLPRCESESLDFTTMYIKGMDIKKGLNNINNDLENYKKMLSLFVKKYENQTDSLQSFQRSKDWPGAERWLHDLAGVTASLYMTSLNETVRKIMDSVSCSKIDQPLVDLFEHQFSELIASLRSFTNAHQEPQE